MTNCDGASDVDSRQTEHRGVRWYMLQVYGLLYVYPLAGHPHAVRVFPVTLVS